MEMKRGDVVICAAPGDYGKPRPAVVVQSDLFNGTHSSVAVCPITSHPEDAPLFRILVPAGRTTGLKRESQVMVDKVIAIPRNKITGRAGTLPASALKEVDHALPSVAGSGVIEWVAAQNVVKSPWHPRVGNGRLRKC
jgi:mRNA interferase MazF